MQPKAEGKDWAQAEQDLQAPTEVSVQDPLSSGNTCRCFFIGLPCEQGRESREKSGGGQRRLSSMC